MTRSRPGLTPGYSSANERLYGFWLPVTGVALATAMYGFFLWRYAMNIPFADDILDVLQVIVGITQSDDAGSTLALLFEQHNDHRTMSSRLLYYLAFVVEGEVDFRTLTFMANMALPLILILLYLAVRDHPYPWLLLLPAAFVLFQLRAYGITFWSMAAFAYCYVYLYGYAALSCLRNVTALRFLLAIACATLATFSLASGQIVWVIGLLSLLHQVLVLKRVSWVYVVLWALATIVVMVLWRYGLETPNSMVQVLALFLETPWHHLCYFLTLLGSAVSATSVEASAAVALLLLSGLCYSSLRHYRDDNIQLELFAWYIVLSTLAMMLGRAPYSTLEYALSSRYSFPSILMVATMTVMLLYRSGLRLSKWQAIPALCACLYCLWSYQTYSVALQPHVDKRVKNFNKKNYWVYGHPTKEMNAIANRAIALDVYYPPARPYSSPEIKPPFAAL
ncbi:MAG: hypothetical protein V7754_12055 [Halioglobus sp.]